jgi:heme-degrading monooxygenase HmoA
MELVVFRSRIRPDNAEEFGALADEMMSIAESMPGFLSYKVFVADDGERCSIIEFDTPEHLQAWRQQADHARAQQRGREQFYESYSLQVGEPTRESRFEREASG